MRVKPNNLQFMTQSQVGKSLIYHDNCTINDMLAPTFWHGLISGRASDRMRAGDVLTLMSCEYRNADRNDILTVLEVVNVIVKHVSSKGDVQFIKPSQRSIEYKENSKEKADAKG